MFISVPATSRVGGGSDDVGWLKPTSIHCSLPHQASVRLQHFYTVLQDKTHTGKVLAREVKEGPSITAVSLKEKYLNLLQNVLVRTIQHGLKKDLKLPAHCCSKKTLLTEAMKKQRLDLCWKYKEWTSADWQKVYSVMKTRSEWSGATPRS
ncbi:hypothetical protein E2C01_077417 [Portunus trituberculatus]|uniref:Uncharacterized protein n=1 Tax=Portunus trituberculatus TaxID=210409 RepID=A0A5B7IK81_PORTR|nr:hypothetical protein [Portunus trituberculatus]